MLRVGFVAGVTPDRWAGRWRAREPTPLELVPVDQEAQRTVLVDGAVDLCLVRLPVDREGLHLVRLYDEQPVVVVPLDHLVTAVDEVELADLADEQLVWGDVPGFVEVSRVDQLAFPPMTAREAVEVVASGTGVAVMPMSLARLHQRRDVTSRPVTDLTPTTVGLAWRVDDQSPLVETFVGIVRGRTANSSRGASADPPAPTPTPAPQPTPTPARKRPARPARPTRASQARRRRRR